MRRFLIQSARFFRVRGFRFLSAFLLEIVSISPGRHDVARQLVIDLLIIGFSGRARQKVIKAMENPLEYDSFQGQEKSFLYYIDWELLKTGLERQLNASTDSICSFLKQSPHLLEGFLPDLKRFSDYILISNSQIELSHSDVCKIKSMKSPVFIFLNHANPSFQKLLVEEGLYKIPHVLIAGKNGLINHHLRLLYKSYGIYNFNLLACLVRNGLNSHFKKNYLQDVLDINKDVSIVCIDRLVSLISLFYAKHSLLETESSSSPPSPSIGWIAIELFTALSQMSQSGHISESAKSIVWLVGFDLSPSYIFEANFKNKFHDFVYEHAALCFRFSRGKVQSMGFTPKRNYCTDHPIDRLTNAQMRSHSKAIN